MGWTAETPDFAALDAAARDRLDRLTPMEVPSGTTLFQPGDAVKGYVIVLAGVVDVRLSGPTGRDLLLYRVAPGQSCIQSTLGLLGGEKDYSAEAVATESSRLVLLPQTEFLSLLAASEAFRSKVFAAFADRVQSMMHLMEELSFLKVEARLAAALLRDAKGTDRIDATHEELATRIGSAREVISRRLNAWEKRGIVRLERGAVCLADRAQLAEIASDGGL